MTDPEFIRAFEDCTLPGDLFNHREHVRLAWLTLRALDPDEAAAERRMEALIRRYATHLGAAGKYHHTLTLFWMRAVAAARRDAPPAPTFEAFVSARPDLLDKTLARRHYSATRLESAEARAGWREPDLLPLDARATIEA